MELGEVFVVGFCSLFWMLRVHKTWKKTTGGYVWSCNLPIKKIAVT